MLLEELAKEQVTEDVGWHCGGMGSDGGCSWGEGEMEESGEEQVEERIVGTTWF